MLNPAVQRKVLEVAEIVDDTLASHKAALSDAVEFFMTLEDDDQTCAYYLVDHRLRVEFWLENVDTDDLDLPPSASEEHLRMCLCSSSRRLRMLISLHRSGFGGALLEPRGIFLLS